MKIVRIYNKKIPNPSGVSTDSLVDRYYLRRVVGARNIGIAFCHTEEQYNFLKKDLAKVYKDGCNNLYRQAGYFKDDRLSIIGYSNLGSASEAPNRIDEIYSYIVSSIVSRENHLDIIHDIILAFTKWYVQPAKVASILSDFINGRRE